MTQQEFNQIYIYNVRTDRIGGGAFGTVYKAYDTVLDREVAIKIAEVKYVGSVELSLRREYEAIKDLPKHPYIARYEGVYTFEAPNGLFDYAVLQYYPDGNLSHLLSQKDLSFEEREGIVIKLLEGIAFLHKHRVVHRDFKPANILVHRRSIQGRMEYIPKIADFGLSKIAFANESSRFENSFRGGTIRYSSPEQLKATEIRLNTDLWSWAVVAYEVLMAKPLFVTTNDSSSSEELHLMEQILDGDFRQALVCLPLKWQNILLPCLERDPEMRIRDADSLLRLLDQNSTTEPKEHLNWVDNTLHINSDMNESSPDIDSCASKEPIDSFNLIDRQHKYKSCYRIDHVSGLPRDSKFQLVTWVGLEVIFATINFERKCIQIWHKESYPSKDYKNDYILLRAVEKMCDFYPMRDYTLCVAVQSPISIVVRPELPVHYFVCSRLEAIGLLLGSYTNEEQICIVEDSSTNMIAGFDCVDGVVETIFRCPVNKLYDIPRFKELNLLSIKAYELHEGASDSNNVNSGQVFNEMDVLQGLALRCSVKAVFDSEVPICLSLIGMELGVRLNKSFYWIIHSDMSIPCGGRTTLFFSCKDYLELVLRTSDGVIKTLKTIDIQKYTSEVGVEFSLWFNDYYLSFGPDESSLNNTIKFSMNEFQSLFDLS